MSEGIGFAGLFGAGLATFLSPCVLPLVPVLIASWASAGTSHWSRVTSTVWFASGFAIAFVALGSGMGAISQQLSSWKPVLLVTAAILMGIFGLRMMKFISLKALDRSFQLPDFSQKLPRGISGLVFGVVFGLAWTPCVGPVLGAVLTYVASKQTSPGRGALMLFVFSQGVALPLIAAAIAFDRIRPLLNRLRQWLPRIEYATGFGLVIFAILMINAARFSPSTSNDRHLPVTAIDHKHERVALGGASTAQARMVFFYSDSCPICHAMEKFLPAFEKDCGSSHFQFSKINVDAPENRAAAGRFQVRAVPTIAVLSPDGDEIIHLVGYQTEGRLRNAARSASGLLCGDMTPRDNTAPNSSKYEENQICTDGKKC